MKQIIIGGREITVPNGYIQAEAEYTKNEKTIFAALDAGPAKELARDAVLTKRVEFHDLYVAGKAAIAPPVKAQPSTFKRICRWAIGHKWV